MRIGLSRLGAPRSQKRTAEAGLTSGGAIEQAGELRSSAIESLRALAALAVLEGHVFGWAHNYGADDFANFLNRVLYGGGFGVFLFFALSGYLLYKPFARRDFGDGRALDYGRYAANRAFRILPLYYVVLILCLLIFDNGGNFSSWWRMGLFLDNFYPQTLNHVDGVMWSLVVEVQFYVLLPFLALALRAISGRSVRLAAFVLGLFGVTSELIRLQVVTFVRYINPRWELSLPATFVFFTAGMLLALVQVRLAGQRPAWIRGVASRSTAWLVAGVAVWCGVAWNYNLDILLIPSSFLVVGAVVLPLERGVGTRLLEWRPLATLGVASYSLYLWHVPILEHLNLGKGIESHYLPLLAVLLPLCCAVALVSYWLVEAPFLRLRRSWSSSSVARSKAAVAAMPEPA